MAQAIENGQVNTHWTPMTASERSLVLKELEAMLASQHFRGSKRYPALLRYVVEATLDDRFGHLKERTLGIEVFGRDPDYDTNADPVVRVSAGEVRKRIAQYYQENGRHSQIQIKLPLGSYAPEFLLHPQQTQPAQPGVEADRPSALHRPAPRGPGLLQAMILGLTLMVLAATGLAVYFYGKRTEPNEAVTQKVWSPLLQSSSPVFIALGTSHPNRMAPETDETSFDDHMSNPYHHVSVSSAIALARLAVVLQEHGKNYEVKESAETSLPDVHTRAVILVGAMNNDWTMRLMRPLRIHFVFENKIARVVDTMNPQRKDWTIDFSQPYSTVMTDYAIVARFRDATTEGPVMVIAGLGPYGTEAASEFVQEPQYLGQLDKALPRGWEKKNFELVLQSSVIGSKAGPPVLLSAVSW